MSTSIPFLIIAGLVFGAFMVTMHRAPKQPGDSDSLYPTISGLFLIALTIGLIFNPDCFGYEPLTEYNMARRGDYVIITLVFMVGFIVAGFFGWLEHPPKEDDGQDV
jgi:hypothetical protein